MDINSLPKDKGDKFLFINDFEIDQNLEKVEFNAESKNVIVICVFYRPQYLRFSYLCLKSLLKYTDALDYEIRIFTNDNLEREVRAIFEPIVGYKIIVDRDFKHDIFRHLKQFEKVCLMDADATILSNKKENVFEKIFARDEVLMNKTSMKVHGEFTNRSNVLNWTEEQMSCFSKRWITSNNDWYLAGISMYPMKYFEDDFIGYSMKFMETKMYDDEAVLMNYFFDKNIPISNVRDYISWIHGELVLEYNKEFPSFVHPFEGSALYSKEVYEHYKSIL